jgi:hypothetical protein
LSGISFCYVLKVFRTLLNAAESNGVLEGVSICNNAPSITHVLFADDSLLLLKVNDESANHLQHVLQLYEGCSGQTINKDKSSIMFSRNTGTAAKESFMRILNISTEASCERYLGLPVYVGGSKMKMFVSQGSGVEKDPRLEREAPLQGQKRDIDQSHGTSNSILCYVML